MQLPRAAKAYGLETWSTEYFLQRAAPATFEAKHDFALHIIRQKPAMTSQIGRDLAFGPPLLGAHDDVIGAPPEGVCAAGPPVRPRAPCNRCLYRSGCSWISSSFRAPTLCLSSSTESARPLVGRAFAERQRLAPPACEELVVACN